MCTKQIVLLAAMLLTINAGCGVHKDSRMMLSQKRAYERKRIEVDVANIADANTTRDAKGLNNPYRRQVVQWHAEFASWSVVDDPSPFVKHYEPYNKDADKDGYVAYPNVNVAAEKTDIEAAERELDQLCCTCTCK